MTKSDLIDHLCELKKMAKGRAELIVNAIFDAMEEALKRGDRIEIRGLGSFEVRHYKSYDGRNPRTGSRVAVRPKRLPFFKVGKELKERVNQGASRERAGEATAGAPPPVPAAPPARPAASVGHASVEGGAALAAAPPSSTRGVRM
jgi:integration host factor subunit beta